MTSPEFPPISPFDRDDPELAKLLADAARDLGSATEAWHYRSQLRCVDVTTDRDPDCGDTDVDMRLPDLVAEHLATYEWDPMPDAEADHNIWVETALWS